MRVKLLIVLVWIEENTRGASGKRSDDGGRLAHVDDIDPRLRRHRGIRGSPRWSVVRVVQTMDDETVCV